MPADDNPIDDLVTVRDLLRWAASRFNAAQLGYGHGTDNAVDEAAFLILHAVHLPIDTLDPWLDARLTRSERRAILDLVERRIATRKPAAYLVGEAWIRGHRFIVDERVIVPRSYLGELLCDQMESAGDDWPLGFPAQGVGRILDLCTGGGSLAILAALAFPEAVVDAVDISTDALEVARRNIAAYGLEERVRPIRSDLFAGLGDRYDLILSNPPYVTDAAVAAFPPEHRAEPALAHAGGADGLEVVRRILAEGAGHLHPHGHLVMEIGTGRAALEATCAIPFLWLDTQASYGEVLVASAEALGAGAAPPVARSRRRGMRRG